MLEKKSFAMSMFANKADLYKAKAEYYEQQAEKLEMALVVSLETTAYLERKTLTLARNNDKLLDAVEDLSKVAERLDKV